MMSLQHVAVFGANGQLGSRIVQALLACEEQTFTVLAIIPPDSPEPEVEATEHYKCQAIDLLSASQHQLKEALQGINAVVSALNGPALNSQKLIQDAAASAKVCRFYPSEYGFHQTYHKPGCGWGLIHPLWDSKAEVLSQALHHPAIEADHMSYTLIGCGDFYNQDRETIWCPWTQREPKGGKYTLHVIGSAEAKADYTHIDDFARFLVATLCEPKKSENAHLNFVSDTISHKEIAALLEKYTAKKVHLEMYGSNDLHAIVEDPKNAPQELQSASSFPVDFWFLVKGAQGEGRFRRAKGEIHNHVFPNVSVTTFDDYLRMQHVDMGTWKDVHGPAKRATAEHAG